MMRGIEKLLRERERERERERVVKTQSGNRQRQITENCREKEKCKERWEKEGEQ